MKIVYKFGNGITEGKATDKELLGGKGANLQEMSGLGLPVPPGFTIPTTFTEQGAEKFIDFSSLRGEEIKEGLAHVEAGLDMPPLYSVRSGSRVSMPGMMDSILNVGLTDRTIPKWYKVFGRKTTYDSYCRLIRMMGESIFGIPASAFDAHLKEILDKYGLKSYYGLHASGYSALSIRYKKVFKKATMSDFPQTFKEQLQIAIKGVFQSWQSPRAKSYRQIHNIPDEFGTAVTVQRMVFGNKNNNSMTGVLFSRNPNNGQAGFVGEYLVNAQGEDVVNGSTTPKNITGMKKEFPKIYKKLNALAKNLEDHYRDMQDIEFTVEDGELFVLQTRTGKRTAQAAFKIVRDFYKHGMINGDDVLNRIKADQYFAMKVQTIDPEFKDKPHYTGLAAGGPVVSGTIVTSSEEALNFNGDCILVTDHTTPDDVAGMNASKGILTRTGGMTCHAAVVGRGMNKTCVVGVADLPVDFIKGVQVTIDGSTGNVWIEIDVPMVSGKDNEDVTFVENMLRSVHNLRITKTVNDHIENGDIIAVRKDTVSLLHKKLDENQYWDILYLTVENEHSIVYYDEDEIVNQMFGPEFNPSTGNVKEVVEKLIETNLSKYADQVVVILPDMKDDGSLAAQLGNHGYEVPKEVEKVEDLMSNAVLTIPENFVKTVVGSDDAYKELVKCLQKSGKKVTIVPVALSIEEAINQYL